MKKNFIYDFIVWILFFGIIINTLVAYIAYRQVNMNEEPFVYIEKTIEDEKTIYKELLYNIIIEETSEKREVSLKLFFFE